MHRDDGSRGGTQDRLFYSFNLDDHVPCGHLLRGIDRVLDLGDLRKHLAPFCSHTGSPSIDPELMIRMLIVGYCFGIRSERRLSEAAHLNLAYRWFCRLDLEDAGPDHSTFSKNRQGRFHQSDVFRHLFEGVLRRCMSEGLLGGEGFAIDASVVKADANRSRGVPGAEATVLRDTAASHAVHEYLDALDATNPSDDVVVVDPHETRKNVSLTDPAASWTAAPGGPAFYAYSTNYLIDLDAGIIVDVAATPAHRSMEVESTKTMIERAEQRFGLNPDRLAGDTAYGAAPMLAWMVKGKGIAPRVPVWDRSERKVGTLSSSEFAWDEQANEYRCPVAAGMVLTERALPVLYPLAPGPSERRQLAGAFGRVLTFGGRHELAEHWHRETLRSQIEAVRERHPGAANDYARIAANLSMWGRHDEAKAFIDTAPDFPPVPEGISKLPDLYNQRIKLMRSGILLDSGNAQEALREIPRALLEAPDPVDRQESLEVYGHALCELGQAARGLAALREAMLLNEQTDDDENAPWTARLRARIGRCAFGQGDYRSAATLAAQARAAFRAQPEVSPYCKAPLTSLERQLGLKLPPV